MTPVRLAAPQRPSPVVEPRGRLGPTDAAELGRVLSHRLEETAVVELDLSGVEHLDLAICSVIIVATRAARRRGRQLRVTGPVKAEVAKMLDRVRIIPLEPAQVVDRAAP